MLTSYQKHKCELRGGLQTSSKLCSVQELKITVQPPGIRSQRVPQKWAPTAAAQRPSERVRAAATKTAVPKEYGEALERCQNKLLLIFLMLGSEPLAFTSFMCFKSLCVVSAGKLL